MSNFQALLEPLPCSSPQKEQERASRGLKAAVSDSNLNWWTGPSRRPPGRVLLLVVAPYSQYDLAFLDLVDERLRGFTPQKVDSVYVSNLMDEDKDLMKSIDAYQTPIAILMDPSNVGPQLAWGKEARDLTADVIEVKPEELTKDMLNRCGRKA